MIFIVREACVESRPIVFLLRLYGLSISYHLKLLVQSSFGGVLLEAKCYPAYAAERIVASIGLTGRRPGITYVYHSCGMPHGVLSSLHLQYGIHPSVRHRVFPQETPKRLISLRKGGIHGIQIPLRGRDFLARENIFPQPFHPPERTGDRIRTRNAVAQCRLFVLKYACLSGCSRRNVARPRVRQTQERRCRSPKGRKGRSCGPQEAAGGSVALGEVEPKILSQIKCAGFMNELLSEVGVNSPVAALVGIGQCAA